MMGRKIESLFKCLFFMAMIILEISALPAGAQTAAPAAASEAAAPTTAPFSKEACLNCHGPFDKLAAAGARYVAPSGEKIVPHRFVPHDSKDAKAIPGCNNCHETHPVPPTAAARLPKPDVQWCYTACHHTNTFESCKKCHK